MTAPTKQCPPCGGAWLYNLTFDHGIDCPLRAADDATLAADYERAGWGCGAPFSRPSTGTEQTLAAALGRPANPSPDALPPDSPASYTLVIPVTTSVRRRLLGYSPTGPWWDPDDPEEAA